MPMVSVRLDEEEYAAVLRNSKAEGYEHKTGRRSGLRSYVRNVIRKELGMAPERDPATDDKDGCARLMKAADAGLISVPARGETVARWRAEGKSVREIAELLAVSHEVISRELKRLRKLVLRLPKLEAKSA